ncbi:OmpA/MotB family protein [Methylogaea oryzae]|uniref:OmpA/MotB family protein n=1 Tax=Methylogaea oryzae TaxID=1295382 RepID=UPI0006D1167A
MLTAEGKTLLDKLRPVLLEHKGRITVEGHTDNQPIATAQFPSNWELSTARASIVTRHLIGLGVAANRVTPAGRRRHPTPRRQRHPPGSRQNRRVGIVLYTE